MEPITSVLALAKIVPSIIDLFKDNPTPKKVSTEILNIAQEVTGLINPDQATQKLLQNPELQIRFQTAITEAQTRLALAAYEDRKDARARDIEFIKAGRTNRRADILAYGALLLFALCLAVLAFGSVQEGQRDLLFTTIGALIMVVKDVYGFEFGSSKGSKDKDQERRDASK